MDKKLTCPMCGKLIKNIAEGDHDKNDFGSHYVSFACFNFDDHNFVTTYFGITREVAIERFTTRPESAWEMFRRLAKGNKCADFERLLCIRFSERDVYDAAVLLLQLPEQEAISIMQQIEKELKDG